MGKAVKVEQLSVEEKCAKDLEKLLAKHGCVLSAEPQFRANGTIGTQIIVKKVDKQ